MMRNTISILCLLIFQCLSYCGDFDQKIAIDTSVRFLENTPFYSETEGLEEHKTIERKIRKDQFSINDDLYMIFRYRDNKFISFWQTILQNTPSNVLLHIWFIDALCQLGDSKNISLVQPYLNSSNDIIRECAANAYGFLGNFSTIPLLQTMLITEQNGYIKETLLASIAAIQNGGYKNKIPYLPVYYNDKPKKIRFFYNQKVITSDTFNCGEYLKNDTTGYRASTDMIYPTQQFICKVKYAPNAGTFANKHGPIYHVGFDGAWFFEGLPVHAVSNGIIKQISHDLSWGTMIAVETTWLSHDTVTIIYGHLSRFISVSIGEEVHVGQRLGQIGNSVSYENGGYWAHLHLGIVKGSYSGFRISGYNSDTLKYENPITFIAKHRGGG
jgi:hypothetical protein